MAFADYFRDNDKKRRNFAAAPVIIIRNRDDDENDMNRHCSSYSVMFFIPGMP